MELLQRKYGHHVDADKVADRMKLCIMLLNRIIDGDYIGNAFMWHDKKWGELEIKFIKETKDYGRLDFSVKNAVTEKEKELEEKQRSRLYKHSDEMLKQDIDLLFNTMKKHIEGWWD